MAESSFQFIGGGSGWDQDDHLKRDDFSRTGNPKADSFPSLPPPMGVRGVLHHKS